MKEFINRFSSPDKGFAGGKKETTADKKVAPTTSYIHNWLKEKGFAVDHLSLNCCDTSSDDERQVTVIKVKKEHVAKLGFVDMTIPWLTKKEYRSQERALSTKREDSPSLIDPHQEEYPHGVTGKLSGVKKSSK